MNLSDLKKLKIPKKTGVYKFFDQKGNIIYVGKAVNLRSRIFSYFQEANNHTAAKRSMLQKIATIKYLETDSEIEALLLEANLIKKYQPDFNIVLRDDKRFTYIQISTEEKWPRIFLTRSIGKQGYYFGPFTSMQAVRDTLKAIRKVWPFRTCKNLPKKRCLYYQINKCLGMCEEGVLEKDYKKIIKEIILFLEAKKKKVISILKKDIKNLQKKIKSESVSEKEVLEKNLQIKKNRLLNLEKILSHHRVLSTASKYVSDVLELAKVLHLGKIPHRIEGYDISNLFSKEAVGSMVVFENGESVKSEYKKFKIKTQKEGDIYMLLEILERRIKRLKESGHLSPWPTPDLIILDGGRSQLNIILKLFSKNKIDISVIAVSKGEKLRSASAPDKIFFPQQKKPLILSLNSPALHIIKRVRDEAHRFAVNYHRQLRRKSFFK